LGILERQLGCELSPAHRLDRAASGLLLFAKESGARSLLQQQFQAGEVAKTYYVLVRGEPNGHCEFREPLRDANCVEQPSVTRAEPCFSFTLPLPHPKGGNRRFTILAVKPETGRYHQIRRHFAGAGFPLLGDTRHGDRRLNREFTALTGLSCLFLRCMELEFRCPTSGERVLAAASRWTRGWHQLFELAGACPLTASPSRAPKSLS
jgi:tRNA pseudouridine65 synthase